MVFNATSNNITAILWLPVLLVKETVGPGENYRPVASHWQTLPHSLVHLTLIEIRTHNISGDGYGGNRNTPENTNDLSQIIDTIYYLIPWKKMKEISYF
jgi:hypothetical protein